MSFVLPLGLWCAVSYVPFIWHPQVRVTHAGGSGMLEKGMLIDREAFEEELHDLKTKGLEPAKGEPANPIFLPAPHKVAKALYTAFTTEPARTGDLWLHQSVWHSIQIIFWGFVASAVIGVPMGVLAGAIPSLSRLIEPFIDFIRYMPAPAFGALCVAVLGLADGPKIAIIFIGTFFQMVLVIANTTRQLDMSLIEAAQTLGANRRQLLTRVVVPGILPNLYNDLRILLGWAWTYLIIAELIGAMSGISYFINQQGKYRNYENVFAGIIIIGVVGLVTDQVLGRLRPVLFPWLRVRIGTRKASGPSIESTPAERTDKPSGPELEPDELDSLDARSDVTLHGGRS
jgi:NitT/TauT family transport system permease protein